MELIKDDPIVAKIQRDGYPYDYVGETGRYWESPDGDCVPEEDFPDFVRQLAHDDPHWVAECLGFELRGLVYG